ncbi:hypothetical protein ANO11243_023540 [Dothideomycetidae sp. 11243]|nr:hypothetical protein ANO11243_023540 [fungal sp. No.11243]
MAASSPLRPKDTTPRQRQNAFPAHPSLPGLSSSENLDSPSRQLLIEFQKLWNDQDRHLQQDLDDQIAQQARRHNEALAQASAEHDRVRKNAEIARERVELEIERERQRREAEEKDRLEQERQAKVAREAEERAKQRAVLERQQKEHSARAAEEREIQAAKARLEEHERQKAADVEARDRQAAEEAARAREKAREAAANAAKAREEAQKAAQKAAHATITTRSSDISDLHKRYVGLHKQLKQMRQYVIVESKKIPALKTRLGDWRREISKSMGQLTSDKAQNRKPMIQIQSTLQEALKFTTPAVDVSPYLISVPHPAPGQQIPLSGAFLYLLNIFAKSIISQFVFETSGGAKAADPIGVVAVSIFANPAFKLNQTIPLIDILLAKYHIVCPLLFCVTKATSQKTVQGRMRMGWQRDGDSFIDEQRHLERMAGLATGWAALTLRDFSKSKNNNPLPNFYYWRAIASITNTSAADLGSSHATVIKSLIEGFVPRFIGFYGVPGRAVLRAALVDLPARTRREKQDDRAAIQAVSSLELLAEVLRRDLKLTLT